MVICKHREEYDSSIQIEPKLNFNEFYLKIFDTKVVPLLSVYVPIVYKE